MALSYQNIEYFSEQWLRFIQQIIAQVTAGGAVRSIGGPILTKHLSLNNNALLTTVIYLYSDTLVYTLRSTSDNSHSCLCALEQIYKSLSEKNRTYQMRGNMPQQMHLMNMNVSGLVVSYKVKDQEVNRLFLFMSTPSPSPAPNSFVEETVCTTLARSC